MIKLLDIYKAVNAVLKQKYGYKIYGHEVIEGFKGPCFFVSITPKTMSNESVFRKKYAYTVSITYFQEKANEVDNLTKIDEIQELFGNNLKISTDSSINLTDYDYDFVGTNTNILQISMDTEFYEKIVIPDNHEIAEQFNLNNNMKG